MTRLPRAWWWLALLVAALSSLYLDALRTGFLNDDYLFLEEAKQHSLLQSISSLGPLGNFFRPLSRQVYFEVLSPLADGRPLVFHLVNFALFLGALALVADLLRVFLPLPGVLAGTLYFATLPFQRVNLTWVSCSQDLLALFFSLGALALFRRGRHGWAAVAYLLAVFSKESALPLPLVLAGWMLWIEPRPAERSGLASLGWRLAPCGMVAALWTGVTWWVRAREPAAASLDFGPEHFAAGYVHGFQSLLGLDHPAGFLRGLMRPGTPSIALLFLAPIALALRGPATADARSPRPALGFAALWLLAFGIVTGPVVVHWSSYYYTLFGVGGALLVGVAATRLRPIGWLVLSTGVLWWHAGATNTRAFAVVERPWVWTSHLTSFYFQRAASLTDSMGRQLLRLEPRPEPRSRFFFSTLPPWAGFQMGNGAQVRALYRDATIESYFYSQFSESTAADRPCHFYYWDGRALVPLYPGDRDPFFQVGSDLLAIDRLEGARHAFRRGLAAGEGPIDHLYWLGWTELWLRHRGAAEAAWAAYGAKDDSVEWQWQMRRARQALNDFHDNLTARRALAAAIRSGIGRPEAHAVLGHLLKGPHPKYAVLELKVATYLKPDDWLARRDLVLGLSAARLDDEARLELAQLMTVWPDWQSDSLLVAAARTMERRSADAAPVVEF